MNDSNQHNVGENLVNLAERDSEMDVVAYALGHLSRAEQASFERRMVDNPSLEQRVQDERAFAESLRDALPNGLPRAEAFQALELVDAPPRRGFQFGVAAAITILGVGLLLSVSTPEPAYEALSSETVGALPAGSAYRLVLVGEHAAETLGWLESNYQLSVLSGADNVLLVGRDAPLSNEQLQALRSHPAIALLEKKAP